MLYKKNKDITRYLLVELNMEIHKGQSFQIESYVFTQLHLVIAEM